jgi:hypothetical protein
LAPAPDQKPPEETNHFRTLATLAPYLWPEGETGLRVRVVLSLIFLVAAKAANVVVPIALARAVDALSPATPGAAIAAVPIGLVLGYGLLRITSAAFGEARDAIFVKVQARASRRIALSVFRHLHALSLRFHLDRQTGGLSRVIERGTRGITFVLDFMLFSIVPTLVEILLVAAILWAMFDISFAAVTLLTIGSYIAFTLVFTDWRLRFRREMNQTDQDANTKAIDSLLNYETVKYFNNEPHEAKRYDASLERYERAYIRSEVTLNALNMGQAAIIAGRPHGRHADGGERGGRGTHDGRRLRAGEHLPDPALPAAELPRLRLPRDEAEPDRHGGHVHPDARGARGGRPARRAALARHGGRGALRCGALRLPPRPDDPEGGVVRRAAGPDARHRRADGGGQVHHLPPAVPLLRRDGRARADRRAGPARRHAGERAGGDRRGAAGHGAVQRHHPLQHRLWPPRRHPGRGGACGATGPGARLRARLPTATTRASASGA